MGSVSAADLGARAPVYKAPPVAPPVATWTGFYAGVIGGYADGTSQATPSSLLLDDGAYPVSMNLKGGFVGGQLGYDYQFSNNVVLGIVGDGAWANLTGSTCAEIGGCHNDPDDSYAKGKVNWLATVRGKLGYAVGPQWLIYATGGVAFAGTEARDTFIDGTHDVVSKATLTGYAVGAGAQYKVSQHFSLGVEYLYTDFGTHTYAFDTSNLSGPLNGASIGTDSAVKLNIIKASASYHF
ncbi:MAG: porin family protein [Bradyrhizobiaceae bacterium]|nr:MAG: porin family protein [Bradyrhizobiaceae bacterium]